MTAMPNGADVITVTLGGKTFKAGRRTADHLKWTIERLAKKHPDATLYVIQPCYNTGVAASAGTHDKDGVLDVVIYGLKWREAQAFLRRHGWAAWWRHTGSWADEDDWHIHMISLGCPGPVGWYVPTQITDYYNHALGLADGHTPGCDKTWFPPDIKATIFDWRKYLYPVTVSLARVQKAARTPSWRLALSRRIKRDRGIVLKALKAEGCETYRQWQYRVGRDLDDFDGLPRRYDLTLLGERNRFAVEA